MHDCTYLGPTFSCIIGLQFHNLKYGDRSGGPSLSPFKPVQIKGPLAEFVIGHHHRSVCLGLFIYVIYDQFIWRFGLEENKKSAKNIYTLPRGPIYIYIAARSNIYIHCRAVQLQPQNAALHFPPAGWIIIFAACMEEGGGMFFCTAILGIRKNSQPPGAADWLSFNYALHFCPAA